MSGGEKRIIRQGEVFFVEDTTGMGRERGVREGSAGGERRERGGGGGEREHRHEYLNLSLSSGTGHYSRAVGSQPRHSVFILVNDNFKATDQ